LHFGISFGDYLHHIAFVACLLGAAGIPRSPGLSSARVQAFVKLLIAVATVTSEPQPLTIGRQLGIHFRCIFGRHIIGDEGKLVVVLGCGVV